MPILGWPGADGLPPQPEEGSSRGQRPELAQPLWSPGPALGRDLGRRTPRRGLPLPTSTRKSSPGVSPPPTPGCPYPVWVSPAWGRRLVGEALGGRGSVPPLQRPHGTFHQVLAVVNALQSTRLHWLQHLPHNPTPQPLHRSSICPVGPGIRQGQRGRQGPRGGSHPHLHRALWWGRAGGTSAAPRVCDPHPPSWWCRAQSVQPALGPQPVLVLGLQPHPLDTTVTGLGPACPRSLALSLALWRET